MQSPLQFLIEFYQTFHSRDWESLEGLLHPDFSYFTDTCTIQNKQQFLSFLKQDTWVGDATEVKNIQQIQNTGDAFAILTYGVQFSGSFGSEQITIHSIETMVLTASNDSWVVIHCHSSNKVA